MDATTARIMVWEKLRKVARADSRFAWDFAEFIADYEGSDKCAELLCNEENYKKAKVVFVTPDANLETFREQCIKDKKIMLMTSGGIKRGIFVIRPGDVPEGREEVASILDGASRFWHYVSLADIAREYGTVDMMVTGASAITPSGIRFGKGHGYFDLEWAMFYENGFVTVDTPVYAVGHDCQVVDGVDLEVEPYDTAMDYIVTTTQVIKTTGEHKKPTHGIIWSALRPDMLRDIPPLQEMWQKIACK